MKNASSLFVALGFITLLSSCDRFCPTDYVVINRTSQAILINNVNEGKEHEHRPYELEVHGVYPDTLEKDSSATILVHTVNLGLKGIIENYENGDTLTYLAGASIFRLSDSVRLTKDTRLVRNWEYRAKGKYSAALEFTIRDEDF